MSAHLRKNYLGAEVAEKLRIIVNAIPLVNIKTGVGRYIEGLYRELQKIKGLEIGFFDGQTVSSSMPSLRSIGSWAKKADLFWRLPTPIALCLRLILHFRRELTFKRLVSEFDLYHETSFFPFRSPVPVVFTIHDLSLLRFPEWHPRERVIFWRLFFRRRLKQAKEIICVSEFTRKEVREFLAIPEKRLHTTLLGYDPFLFRPASSEEKERVRKKYSLPEVFYLVLGTGDPRKNFRLVDKASPLLPHPVVSAGWSGWSSSPEKRIHFLGYVPDRDLAGLYSLARAFIFPSLYEGFGLPVLEAMACSCPVVISKEASLPEIGGDAALYIKDVNDPFSLVKEIKKLEDPFFRNERKRKVLRQAQRFSWEDTAQKTHKIFLKALR